MQRLNLASVADRLASRISTVAATVVDYRMVTPTLAQVVATFNTIDTDRHSLATAVGAALNNGAAPIEGSFRTLSSYGNPAMVGFVTVNRETRPFEEASTKGMVALASNMLMDAKDDSLWEVRSDGSGNKMLCRQEADSLHGLMETARVRVPRAPKLDNVMAGVDRGNFVAFVDPQTETLRYGYVLATDLEITPAPAGGLDLDPQDRQNAVEVLPFDEAVMSQPDNTSDEATGDGNRIAERLLEDNAPVTVPASLIVESANFNGDDKVAEVATPTNGINKQSLLDYYKRLYSYSPDYYAQVTKIINNHAGF
jgi:hypothetical protein